MATTRPHIPRAPYVDPNTNIIYETDNPEYHGWLTKQSMWLKVRKKRTLFFLCVLFFGIRSTFKTNQFSCSFSDLFVVVGYQLKRIGVDATFC